MINPRDYEGKTIARMSPFTEGGYGVGRLRIEFTDRSSLVVECATAGYGHGEAGPVLEFTTAPTS